MPPIEQPNRTCGHCSGQLRWNHPEEVSQYPSRSGRFSHTATCTACGRGHAWRNLEGYGPAYWVMDDGTGYYRPL